MTDVRRYRGRTPGEAMKKARDELGDDARLISARRVSAADLPPVYEVRVSGAPADAVSEDTAGLGALRKEIESLRESISTLRSDGPEKAEHPLAEQSERIRERDSTFERWLEVLRRRGVGAVHAKRIVEAAAHQSARGSNGDPYEALMSVLSEELGSEHKIELGTRSTIFVGPTGAGKTTVVSKVAADLARKGESPVLVSTDGESLTGEESLQAIADALGLQFETAFLTGRMESLTERFDLSAKFLVDTPGRSPFERQGLSDLRQTARSLPGAEVLLVLPATMDEEEARLLLEGFEPLGVDSVIVSKLDELCRPGRLMDLAKALSRPISWVTYGRAVRGASSSPTDPRVLSRILGASRAIETTA